MPRRERFMVRPGAIARPSPGARIAMLAVVVAIGWLCLPRRTESYVSTAVPVVGSVPVAPPGPVLPAPEGLESFVNSIGMRMIRIPPGTFVRGSPTDEPGRRGEEQQVAVRMVEPFWISQTEVTQAQFRILFGYNRSRFTGDLLPATNISQFNAKDFCMVLGFLEGKEYRLPTETEWEYACRAGTTTPYAAGDVLTAGQARFATDPRGADEPPAGSGGPLPVGSFPPNAWGLHDMHGNVAEWLKEPYHPRNVPKLDDEDYRYFIASFDAPIRGGGWCSPARACRSAARDRAQPSAVGDWIGFRLVIAQEEGGDDE